MAVIISISRRGGGVLGKDNYLFACENDEKKERKKMDGTLCEAHSMEV